ncbi:MAG TPA: DUF2231 domain-containing protein [Gemmatimonadaceae bacterium]|jgi:uncharacterized membrane protein|nr:DUF2231 domain-containing protein [Gemmatimonadaceae bacterium]
MLPNPLHPSVVHFPVVIGFLLPIIVGGTLWAIHRGAHTRRAWSIPVVAALMLAASAWVAVETGEDQEDRVERVVGKQPLAEHSELAETFLAVSAGLALIAVAGLVGGVAGRAARIVTAAGSLALAVGATIVGHSGGQLVYRYGAAAAYVPASSVGTADGETSIRATPRADPREAHERP